MTSADAEANDPLVNLLRLRKDHPVMTDDERRSAVMELRALRTSPQALGKALRQQAMATGRKPDDDSDEEDDAETVSPRQRRVSPVSTADLYKELGL